MDWPLAKRIEEEARKMTKETEKTVLHARVV
jgi:hypothetical protein